MAGEGHLGAIDLTDLQYSTTRARTALTTINASNSSSRLTGHETYDFLTLISLISNLYRAYEGELITMKHLHQGPETYENSGLSCIVHRRAVETSIPSNLIRGQVIKGEENIAVKREKQGIFGGNISVLKSFITELRVRAHPPLRAHPNIVELKGVAWDFEDEERTKPRPLLLEELALEGSLEKFWTDANLTRMPFKRKAGLSLDIAHGLTALHKCGIVHGDIKPGNILIFSNPASKVGFTAKLTDFGHSVFAYEGRTSLLAFTFAYRAPEATAHDLTFDHMKLTDVYSFGLVMLSLVIGRDCCKVFGDSLGDYKENDSLFDKAMALVEEEDRMHTDSDLDLSTLRELFTHSIKLDCGQRNLNSCITLLQRFNTIQNYFSRSFAPNIEQEVMQEIAPLPDQLYIGYKSLIRCSHHLKEKVVQELEEMVRADKDSRRAAACWELCVCYFAAFGTDRNLSKSRNFLVQAAEKGVLGARAFFHRLHRAMEIDPQTSLQSSLGLNADESAKRISDWLFQAATDGYMDVIPDLRQINRARYRAAKHVISEKLGEIAQSEVETVDSAAQIVNVSISSKESELAKEVTRTTGTGDLTKLKALLDENPRAVNFQDDNGDTALIQAARCKRFTVLTYFLKLQGIDCGIYNWRHQNCLHFLANFSQKKMEKLIPRLLLSNVNIDQEAVAVPSNWGRAHDLMPHMRCDPMLQAVLGNNIHAVQVLLNEVHTSRQRQLKCRTCESGPRYRKIMAMAIMLHHYRIMELLLKHRQENTIDETWGLGCIEVWDNQDLLPAWQLALRGRPASVLDMPESFCRALSHGEDYAKALSSTLNIIWTQENPSPSNLRNQLQQSVILGNVEAIECIINKARDCGFHDFSWWSDHHLLQHPLLLSIQLGYRDVFEKVWSMDRHFLSRKFIESCSIPTCRTYRQGSDFSITGSFLAYIFLWPKKKKKHDINFAQVSLSLAAVASHQDDFFLSSILGKAPQRRIGSDAQKNDDRRSCQPTSCFTQAILADSFRNAKLILAKYPDSLWQKVCIIPRYLRTNIADSYTTTSYLDVFDLTSETYPDHVPLVSFILAVGSYKQCRFVLQQCAKRDSRRSPGSTRVFRPLQRRRITDDGAEIEWERVTLTAQQFHYLLLGLVRIDRKDRRGLWTVVRAQVEMGHSMSWYYLRMALFYANCKAVEGLIDSGWQKNGPPWARLRTPLDLARQIAINSTCILPSLNAVYYKRYGPGAKTGVPQYFEFQSWYNTQFSQQKENSRTNVRILERVQASGGSFSSQRQHIALLVYSILYLIVIPFTIGFLRPSQHYSLRATFFLAYYYAFMAMVFPPIPVFYIILLSAAPRNVQYKWIVRFIIASLQWATNNICLPFIIFHFPMDVSPSYFFVYMFPWLLINLGVSAFIALLGI